MQERLWRMGWDIVLWEFPPATVPLAAACEQVIDALGDFASVSAASGDSQISGEDALVSQGPDSVGAVRRWLASADVPDRVTLALSLNGVGGEGQPFSVDDGARVTLADHAGSCHVRVHLDCDLHDPDSETGRNREVGWLTLPRLRAVMHRLARSLGGRPRVTESRTCSTKTWFGFEPVNGFVADRAAAAGLTIERAIGEAGGRGVYQASVPGSAALVVAGDSTALAPDTLTDEIYNAGVVVGLPLWFAGNLPDGRIGSVELAPSGRRADYRVDDPRSLAVELGEAMCRSHRDHDETLSGLRPELIYLDDTGGLAGLSTRWKRVLELTRNPSLGSLLPFGDIWDPPEVLGGGAPDPASDAWLLAALASTWFAGGTYSFASATPLEQIGRILAGQAAQWQGPSAAGPLFDRALVTTPSERPTVTQLVDALQR